MTLFERILTNIPFSATELRTLIATAPRRYKVYRIPKRTPGAFRTIAQPSPEIKLLQNWLVHHEISKWPLSPFATAYRPGSSTAKHAMPHAPNRFLLKLDFSDFFPSILATDIAAHAKRVSQLLPEDIRVLIQLVCWLDKSTGIRRLSIGAPSSPAISNTVLFDFDQKVTEYSSKFDLTYTRYADDLAFSTNTPNVLKNVEQGISEICAELEYPKLRLNRQKTVSTSKRHRRSLVGLLLTPESKISIGRAKKRHIRSSVYRQTKGLLLPEKHAELRGQLAYIWSVEPDFIYSLLRQFGEDPFRTLGLPFTERKSKK